MGSNRVEMVRDTYDRPSPARAGTVDSVIGVDMIGVFMDESDWNFVIDSLRVFRCKVSVADTKERLAFTADSIQDVLDGAR
jgi:hypothetical protein